MSSLVVQNEYLKQLGAKAVVRGEYEPLPIINEAKAVSWSESYERRLDRHVKACHIHQGFYQGASASDIARLLENQSKDLFLDISSLSTNISVRLCPSFFVTSDELKKESVGWVKKALGEHAANRFCAFFDYTDGWDSGSGRGLQDSSVYALKNLFDQISFSGLDVGIFMSQDGFVTLNWYDRYNSLVEIEVHSVNEIHYFNEYYNIEEIISIDKLNSIIQEDKS